MCVGVEVCARVHTHVAPHALLLGARQTAIVEAEARLDARLSRVEGAVASLSRQLQSVQQPAREVCPGRPVSGM